MQDSNLSSPLRWAGNKQWLAKRTARLIAKEVEPASQVVELFAGSLGFSLHFGFKNVVANDIDTPLINFYRSLQTGFLPSTDYKVEKEAYYFYRERYNDLVEQGQYNSELASLFFYLNATCFNGLLRKSKSGRFNVPFGKFEQFPVNKIDRCIAVASHIKSWKFSSVCFSEVAEIEEAGLILADPPYEGTYTGYNGGFSFEEQIKLIETLDNTTCPTIITNSMKSKELLCLYRDAGYRLYKTLVRRSISAKKESRNKQYEVVALKNIRTQRVKSLCPELELVRI